MNPVKKIPPISLAPWEPFLVKETSRETDN
jgi:hypothetical protein